MTADGRIQRLHRLDRIFVCSPIYFVTMCTHHRRKLLATEAIHCAFLGFADDGPIHGAWIGRYVLMPDHLHLFVAIDEEKLSLAKWAKSLKNSISKVLRMSGVPSPHWQKTFFDHLLRSSESYSEKWNYVHENPVRAELVTTAEDWPFQGEVFRLDFGPD